GGTRLERSVNPSIGWLFGGLLCVFTAATFSYLSLSTGPRWLSFGGAFFVLAGFSFLVPRVLFHFSRAAGNLLRRFRFRRRNPGIEVELAVANLSRGLLR